MTDRQRARRTSIQSVFRALAWVAAGAIAVLLAFSLPWVRQFPVIGIAMACATAWFVGLKGLWGFWNSTSAWDLYARGYQVRWVARQDFVYEEFGEDDMLRGLGFGHVRRVEGYAPPHRISLPTEEQWPRMTPPWAHGRRTEIADRLIERFQRGKDPDPRVTIVALGSLEAD